MLYSDVLIHISIFCDFKTRINFKKSSKQLYENIRINLLHDESEIDVSFMENTDNMHLLFDYFYRKYVQPYLTYPKEPYLKDIFPTKKPVPIIYARSMGEIIFEEILKNKLKYFDEIRELWYGFSEGKYEEDEIVHIYTAEKLWDGIFTDATDWSESCYIWKINPKSPRIVGNVYISDLFNHFKEDIIDEIF